MAETAIDYVRKVIAGSRKLTIQLSNLCNYSEMHRPRNGEAGCPTALFKERQVLPATIVYDILDTVAEAGWGWLGTVRWHVYNEPLLDPRLMAFTQYVRKLHPKIGIHVWTNGWYLTEDLARDLVDAGITEFTVSCYSRAEQTRLHAIAQCLQDTVPILSTQRLTRLTHRVLATEEIIEERYKKCRAPFRDLTIRASGHIGLCCLDWAEVITFGDLHATSFRDAIMEAYPRMKALSAELFAGVRTNLVCRQCQRSR